MKARIDWRRPPPGGWRRCWLAPVVAAHRHYLEVSHTAGPAIVENPCISHPIVAAAGVHARMM